MSEDTIFIESHQELSKLVQRKFPNKVYEKVYPKTAAAQIANTIFVSKNADDKCFVEYLADHMKESDDKVKSI